MQIRVQNIHLFSVLSNYFVANLWLFSGVSEKIRFSSPIKGVFYEEFPH